MHVEWWITEREEVKHLARGAQRNRPGLQGASQDMGRQSCRHLRALRPAHAATPPFLTNCWQRWQGRHWECIKGDKRENRTDQISKKKKKSSYFSSACWRLCNLSEHSGAHNIRPVPGSAAAQGLAGFHPAGTPGSRGLAGSRNGDTGLVGASGLSVVACAWRPGEVVGPEPVLLPAEGLFVFPEWINTNPKGWNVALASYTSPRMHSDCMSLLENRNQFALKCGCDTKLQVLGPQLGVSSISCDKRADCLTQDLREERDNVVPQQESVRSP